VAVGADICAGLKEVEEALDLGFLSALDGEDDALSVTRSGGFAPFCDQGILQQKDITGGVWERVRHRGERVIRLVGPCDAIF
jgi:hypothetical protein